MRNIWERTQLMNRYLPAQRVTWYRQWAVTLLGRLGEVEATGTGRVGRHRRIASWRPAVELLESRNLLSPVVYGDFNHDGYTDMAIGIPCATVNGQSNAGAVEVLYGSANGLTNQNSLYITESLAGHNFFPSAAGHEFGYSLAVGDFNGDGYADLAVGVPFDHVGPITDTGDLFVFNGGPNGLSIAGNQLWNLQAPGTPHFSAKHDHWTYSLAAGDFNGDGYCDLAIGSPGTTPDVPNNPPTRGIKPGFHDTIGGGAMFVMYGGPTGLSANGMLAFDPTGFGMQKSAPDYTNEHFGWTVTVGDFNGDGYMDIATSAPFRPLGPNQSILNGGGVTILYGGPQGITPKGSQYFDMTDVNLAPLDTAESGDVFGYTLSGGDFNGDGYWDLAVGIPGDSGDTGTPHAGAVEILYGTPNGLTSSGAQRFTQASMGRTDQTGSGLGTVLATGDFNGNGMADLVIGLPGDMIHGQVNAGGVFILYGSSAGLTTAGKQFWTQTTIGQGGSAAASQGFGSSLGVGDFKADGHDDLTIGVPGYQVGSAYGAGAVDVLYGSSLGLATTNDQFWTEDNIGNGDSAANPGDHFGGSFGTP
jgi:hypothetical protein